jgi:hypothetical protein
MLSHRRWTWAVALALALTVTAVWAGPPVAIVLKNGQRYSGTLVAQRGNRIYLQIDNRQRNWPETDIAIIEFVPGQANQREMTALATVPAQIGGATAAAVAMQDGRVLTGRFGGVLNDGQTVAFSVGGRNRAELVAGDIARLYLDPAVARRLYSSNAVVNLTPQSARPAANVAEPAGSFTVDARTNWMRTGVNVRQGERLTFDASGQVRWGSGRQQVAGPEGAAGQVSARRNFPVQQLDVGALVGRIGNGPPFAIGGFRGPIAMPADGELRLAINDDRRNDNSGSFLVRIFREDRPYARPGGARGMAYSRSPGDYREAGTVRVDAIQAWHPTDFIVRRGEPIVFEATGRVEWGRGVTQVAGPEGVAIDAPLRTDYPVPSAGVGALVGRIEDGQPFLIGASSEPIVMPASGRLYLGVNDSSRTDNSGAFMVRVSRDPQYAASQRTGIPGREQADWVNATDVRVSARVEWTWTDVTVRQGEWLAFQATGQVAWGQGETQVTGPDGTPMAAINSRTYPVPSAGVGALVARIDNGTPFFVGAGTDPVAMPATGRLFLGINDSGRDDNNGFFTVRIARVGRR